MYNPHAIVTGRARHRGGASMLTVASPQLAEQR